LRCAGSFRRLRRRCEARLRDLPLPRPFGARALGEVVAVRRNRPLRILPMTGQSGVLGLWLATDDADLVFFEQATTPPHQEHIILHELCHLLCDHYASPLPVADFAQALLPGLDPEMVRRVLQRTSYTEVEEQEAELLASLILQRAQQESTAEPERTCGEDLADRIASALAWPEAEPGGE
jgi:hypothetical protein